MLRATYYTSVKRFLFVTILFFIADRLIKHFAPSINLEGGFVNFGFYQNYAGALSLPIAGWAYNIAGIILLAVFAWLFIASLRGVKRRSNPNSNNEIAALPMVARNDSAAYSLPARQSLRLQALAGGRLTAYGFIILGGASNLFDRLFYGYTIDYVNVADFSFFNIADGMLIVGIIILFFDNFISKKVDAKPI